MISDFLSEHGKLKRGYAFLTPKRKDHNMTKQWRLILLILLAIALPSLSHAQDFVGDFKVVTNAQYELGDLPIYFEKGKIVWLVHVEVWGNGQLYEGGEGVTIRATVKVKNSTVPYVMVDSEGWWLFDCSFIIKENEQQIQKMGMYCHGIPTFEFEEVFPSAKLTLTMNMRIIVADDGTVSYPVTGRLSGLIPRMVRFKGKFDGHLALVDAE